MCIRDRFCDASAGSFTRSEILLLRTLTLLEINPRRDGSISMMISSFVCSLEFISERSGKVSPSIIAMTFRKVSPGPEAGPFNEL